MVRTAILLFLAISALLFLVQAVAAQDPLSAGFTYSPSEGAVPFTVQFTDTSTGATSWEYLFDDGTSATERNPSHQYRFGGNRYKVIQNVYNGVEQRFDEHFVLAYTSVPGRIEAEAFDGTGEDDAYDDSTPGNTGGAYRQTDVDIEAGGTNYNVGWIAEGEVLKYTIKATAAGTYPVTIRAGAWNSGRTIQVMVDGSVAGTVTTPQTGSNRVFADVSLPVTLSVGVHTLALVFHGGSQNIDYVVFNSPSSGGDPLSAGFTYSLSEGAVPFTVQFTDTSTGATSWEYLFDDGTSATERNPSHQYRFGGNRYKVIQNVYNGVEQRFDEHFVLAYTSVPGRIEAEAFDGTGEDDAYDDSTPGNTGGAYRQTDVDIEAGGTNYNVGWIAEGEVLKYTIKATAAGTYPVTIRAGAWNSGRTIQVMVDGSVAGTVTTPQTGSNRVFADVSLPVTLSAGVHTLALVFHGGSQNVDYIIVGSASSGGSLGAGFALEPATGAIPLTVQVVDESSGATSWKYTFGDGASSTLPAPSHLYKYGGFYTVMQTVGNGVESRWDEHSLIAYSPVPGTRIEAENYNVVNEDTQGYYDTNAWNEGGAYRNDGVDVESCPEGGYNVAFIREGEWLRYTLRGSTAGTYPMTIRAGNWEPGTTKTIDVQVNGVKKATITVPMTASSSKFAEASANVAIPAGFFDLTLVFHGGRMNVDWFRI
jgi:PKD repeat protein